MSLRAGAFAAVLALGHLRQSWKKVQAMLRSLGNVHNPGHFDLLLSCSEFCLSYEITAIIKNERLFLWCALLLCVFTPLPYPENVSLLLLSNFMYIQTMLQPVQSSWPNWTDWCHLPYEVQLSSASTAANLFDFSLQIKGSVDLHTYLEVFPHSSKPFFVRPPSLTDLLRCSLFICNHVGSLRSLVTKT